MFIKLPTDITTVALLGVAYSSNIILKTSLFWDQMSFLRGLPSPYLFKTIILNIYYHKYLKSDIS